METFDVVDKAPQPVDKKTLKIKVKKVDEVEQKNN